MRATIDIDEKLFNEAKQITKIKTKKDLINASLSEIIRQKRLEHLISLFGTSPIDITKEDLEEFRKYER
jgi:hypothetical protein